MFITIFLFFLISRQAIRCVLWRNQLLFCLFLLNLLALHSFHFAFLLYFSFSFHWFAFLPNSIRVVNTRRQHGKITKLRDSRRRIADSQGSLSILQRGPSAWHGDKKKKKDRNWGWVGVWSKRFKKFFEYCSWLDESLIVPISFSPALSAEWNGTPYANKTDAQTLLFPNGNSIDKSSLHISFSAAPLLPHSFPKSNSPCQTRCLTTSWSCLLLPKLAHSQPNLSHFSEPILPTFSFSSKMLLLHFRSPTFPFMSPNFLSVYAVVFAAIQSKFIDK